MRVIRVLILIAIAAYLGNCLSEPPQYVAKPNNYNFDFFNDKNGTLLSENLVYTYTTESLEQTYYKAFCADTTDCNININNVKNSPIFGNFDLSKNPISHNNLGISKVNVYRITYNTLGQKHDLRHVSGAVFIPNIPANKIKGAVLYFHPTFFAKTSTPSFGMTSNSQDSTIAAVFAAQGYIIIAPDYIGMGIDTSVPHPYIFYPLVNANDGLSMLTASSKFLSNLGYSKELPLLVTGVSEGASYTMWFSRLYQEQAQFKKIADNSLFKLTLIAPISGAYNLSNVIYHYLFDNISILNKDTYHAYSSMVAARLKPGLSAFALVSYGFYNLNGAYDKVLRHDFFTMQCTIQQQKSCNFDGKNLTLAEAFDQKNDLEIVDKIVNAASYKYYDGSMFTTQSNNIKPLVNPNIFSDKQFVNTFERADIYYWHSDFPTVLIYLQNDSVVSPYNTMFAYRGMHDNKSKNVKKLEIDNDLIQANASSFLPNFRVDHVIELPYVTLTALKEFEDTINENNLLSNIH